MNETEFKKEFNYRSINEKTCKNCKYSCDSSFGFLSKLDENYSVCKNLKLDDLHYGIAVDNNCICDLWGAKDE